MQKPEHRKLRTTIAVKTIPARPYKIYVEVRRTDEKGKYSLTIVSKDERKIYNIAKALEERGYKYHIYRDSYGFTRLNMKNVNYSHMSYILVMLKYWANRTDESKLLQYA